VAVEKHRLALESRGIDQVEEMLEGPKPSRRRAIADDFSGSPSKS
jgi:hypothetical protein